LRAMLHAWRFVPFVLIDAVMFFIRQTD
jgi:hypothetical protein